MVRFIFIKLGQIIFTVSLFYSCHTQNHNKKEIEQAMQKYDRLIQEMNKDSIALLYAKDGDLGQMAHGWTSSPTTRT